MSLRLAQIAVAAAPRQRQRAQLLRPDRSRKPHLELFEHPDPVIIAAEFDQAFGGLAAERRGRFPGEPPGVEQLGDELRVLVANRRTDLVGLLLGNRVLFGGEMRSFRTERPAGDAVEQT